MKDSNRTSQSAKDRPSHYPRRNAMPNNDASQNQHHPKQTETAQRRPERSLGDSANEDAPRASRSKNGMLPLPFNGRSLATLGGPFDCMNHLEIMEWIKSVRPFLNGWYNDCLKAAKNKQARRIAAEDYMQFAEDILEACRSQHQPARLDAGDLTNIQCPSRKYRKAMADKELDLAQHTAVVACNIVVSAVEPSRSATIKSATTKLRHSYLSLSWRILREEAATSGKLSKTMLLLSPPTGTMNILPRRTVRLL